MFEATQDLHDAVVRLLAEDPLDLPPGEALARLSVLLQAREQLQAAVLTAVRDLDVRELYALDGAGSARGWLRAQVSGDDGQLALARRLAQRPGVAAALADGRVAVRTAGQLCTALDKVPTEVDDATVRAVLVDGVGRILAEASGGPSGTSETDLAVLRECCDDVTAAPADRLEPAVVLLATRLTPNVLGTALRSLVDPLLPDGTEADECDPYYVELRPLYDGDWDLRGLLDPETGQSLKAELDRRRTPDTSARHESAELLGLFSDVDETVRADDGHDPAVVAGRTDDEDLAAADAAGTTDDEDLADADAAGTTDDERLVAADAFVAELPAPRPDRPGAAISAGRLRHDVLTQLLRDARDRSGGLGAAPAPVLTVVAHLDTLLGRAGAAPALLDHPGRAPVHVSAETLRRLGCSADVAAVLLDAAGRPVGASSTRRSANRRERRALRARWGPTCAVRGCPSTSTVPHHVVPWWASRRTVLEDLVPLCEHCHRDLHEGHRTLVLRDHRWIDDHGWAERPATALAA